MATAGTRHRLMAALASCRSSRVRNCQLNNVKLMLHPKQAFRLGMGLDVTNQDGDTRNQRAGALPQSSAKACCKGACTLKNNDVRLQFKTHECVVRSQV